MSSEVGANTGKKRAGSLALVYLRVSTEEQTKTDYDPDGLSMKAQREGVEQRAGQLSSTVDKEFGDPGKSAFKNLQKRTGFLELLEELKQRNAPDAPTSQRISYVIVWSCSRWARNVVDHWQARNLMNELGVRFISVMEPIVGENTAAAFAYENLIVSQGQYQSMYSGELVKRGLFTKAKNGGTYGQAKTGYVNAIERLPNGSQVRVIHPDPERANFITHGFDLFATGRYTISSLTNELYDLGLRSRPSSRYPGGQKVSTSSWQRILRDAYYTGLIIYKKGTPEEQVFPGLHEPLTDEDTFEKVQVILDQHRVSGERPQHRHHYLKGSLYCEECRLRLTYGVSTGRNEREYPYFFCSSRINETDCAMRANLRPELIENAIQRVYESKPIKQDADELGARIKAVEKLAAVSREAAEHVKTTKAKLVEKLQTQQARLLRLHVEEGDTISPDAFREERTRLQADIDAAEKSLATAERRLTFDSRMLCMALELVPDVAGVYDDAPDFIRRAYNQAFYKRFSVRPKEDGRSGKTVAEIADAELAWPFNVVLAPAFAEQVGVEVERIRQQDARDDPEGSSLAGSVSIFEDLAEGEGFEPSRRR